MNEERGRCIFVCCFIFFVSLVSSVSDVSVFQGQYYNETDFIQGNFIFEFQIYDAESGGNLITSNLFNVTTGSWGQWKVEVDDLSRYCDDVSRDYFVEILVDGDVQGERRRLTHFNYLRKNVEEFSSGTLDAQGLFVNGTSVCLSDGTNCIGVLGSESVFSLWDKNASDDFSGDYNDLINTPAINFIDTNCSIDGSCPDIVYESELNYTIDTDTNAATICLNDEVLLGNGSCQSSSEFGSGGNSGTQYVSFISTVDGKINKNGVYLGLGTDAGISQSSSEMSWVIDRDMVITGILWDSLSNTRTQTSAITLMSGSSKNNLVETSLSKDIQGVTNGIDNSFNVILSQGDSVAIKYLSGGNGGDIEDLSITLIGYYI